MFHDLDFLDVRIDRLMHAFPGNALHAVAIKANPLVQILKHLQSRNLGVEAASIGEVMLALHAGFSPDRIVFDSPVKTMEEIEQALSLGIHINADNFDELARIDARYTELKSTSSVGLRINPQVGVGTIATSSVAGIYSKFGVPITTNQSEILSTFQNYPWLTGLHLHVGSQGCGLELLVNGVEKIAQLLAHILAHGKKITHFDIGGGLPVSYSLDIPPFTVETYASEMYKVISRYWNTNDPEAPRIITEFGRWVHVNAGWSACRIEYCKHDQAGNTALIHAGADLFLRECLLPTDWSHRYLLVNPRGESKGYSPYNQPNTPERVDHHLRQQHGDTGLYPYNLAGPLCFSGDILAKNVLLPKIEAGDYILVKDSGGYTLSMWSRYNSRLMPRVLGYRGDPPDFSILKERESNDNIIEFWK